jgi:serine/threonine-protein kinase
VGEALGCFAEAVQLDPAFGPPHAGLADAYLLFSFGGIIAPGEAWALAGECAERALALDPEAAEAYVSLAWTTVFRDWDWPEARRLFDRALALRPTAAFPRLWLGLLRLALGDAGAARGSLAQARERDPLSALLFLVLALERIVANDHETALSLGRDAVRLRPEHFVSHWVLAMALSASGRSAQARTAQRRALGLSDGGPVMKAVMASMLARAGDEGGARALLDELDRATGFPSAYARGAVLVALGDRERGLDRLSEAADQREPWVPFMGIDPAWDTVRGAPRYVRLKERVFARS